MVARVGVHRVQRQPRDPTKTAVRYLFRFCQTFEIEDLPLTEMETTVLLYLLWKLRGVQPDTLSRYLSHIRTFYWDIGIRLRHDVGKRGQLQVVRPEITKWLQALRKVSTVRRRKSEKFVVDVVTVTKLIRATDRSCHNGRMLCFAWALSVMRSMREDDIAPFDPVTLECHERKKIYGRDLAFTPSVHNPKRVVLDKWWRKNHTYGPGAPLGVSVTGRTLCAVTLGAEHILKSGIGPGDLVFAFEDGTPLTTQAYRELTQGGLHGIGVDLTHFTGISFRKGGAQSGVWAGLSDDEVRQLGDWAAGSKEFARYRRRTVGELADMAAKVVMSVCED